MGRAHALLAVLAICTLAACGSTARPAASIRAGSASPGSNPNPALVEWLPLPATNRQIDPPRPTPADPVAIPPHTPACIAAQLEVGRGAGNGATGHVNQPIILRNRENSACVLRGYPDLTITGAGGQVLTHAEGTAGRGTFFDDGPSVEILMQPGTTPLKSTWDPATPLGVRGQAYVNIEWWDCKARPAELLLVYLADGGGQMSLPFSGLTPVSPACDAPTTATSYLARGPFEPSGFQWPPPPNVINTVVTISAPATVHRGSVLVYAITLTNLDSRVYQLNPCPDYFEFIGGKLARWTYELNCAAVGEIAPGANAAFAMQMPVPATVPIGPAEIRWGLIDGRISSSYAVASVQIVG